MYVCVIFLDFRKYKINYSIKSMVTLHIKWTIIVCKIHNQKHELKNRGQHEAYFPRTGWTLKPFLRYLIRPDNSIFIRSENSIFHWFFYGETCAIYTLFWILVFHNLKRKMYPIFNQHRAIFVPTSRMN